RCRQALCALACRLGIEAPDAQIPHTGRRADYPVDRRWAWPWASLLWPAARQSRARRASETTVHSPASDCCGEEVSVTFAGTKFVNRLDQWASWVEGPRSASPVDGAPWLDPSRVGLPPLSFLVRSQRTLAASATIQARLRLDHIQTSSVS